MLLVCSAYIAAPQSVIAVSLPSWAKATGCMCSSQWRGGQLHFLCLLKIH